MYWGLLPLSSRSFMGALPHFACAIGFRVTAQGTVGALVGELAIEVFTASCFVELTADGRL